MSDYNYSVFNLNTGPNGRINTSEFSWLDLGLRTP